jgi:hypothetical protein
MIRYAQHAAAVVFALLAAGFVALWVRSCYHLDFVEVPLDNNQRLTFTSSSGCITCDWAQLVNDSRRRFVLVQREMEFSLLGVSGLESWFDV